MRAVPEQRSLGNVEQQNRDARLAMWLSLIVGLFMLVGKVTAYLFTGSSAIFSDAAESVGYHTRRTPDNGFEGACGGHHASGIS